MADEVARALADRPTKRARGSGGTMSLTFPHVRWPMSEWKAQHACIISVGFGPLQGAAVDEGGWHLGGRKARTPPSLACGWRKGVRGPATPSIVLPCPCRGVKKHTQIELRPRPSRRNQFHFMLPCFCFFLSIHVCTHTMSQCARQAPTTPKASTCTRTSRPTVPPGFLPLPPSPSPSPAA